MRTALRLGLGGSLLALCAGCRGWQSALDPQGPEARHLRHLIWLFTGVAALVWVLVMVVLFVAIRRRCLGSPEPVALTPPAERRATFAVGVASVATVIVLALLTAVSYRATGALGQDTEDAVNIRLRGYQWWWEATYLGPLSEATFVTANELHIPVGRPVTIDLSSDDVIHSFWVPNLAGKQDLIPGRDNRITITADHAGTYRGPCAEFCGLQHAHMSLFVIAEPPAEFDKWRDAQKQPAAAPGGDEQQAGQQIVTGTQCAACHTIRGTAAKGTVAPDLTHLASRFYLAAGELPMTRGSLAAWVADPQTIKPGNNMPQVPLTGDELRAVSAYLASLK
ncbi:MAG TPA: cytochrome c oxidase subunit II [Stellaceae bacterium]|jgi:cytochrome c oxidase subunit 2|nr:cytochrome c oxidase subunit II [Stellaceae bacterium]